MSVQRSVALRILQSNVISDIQISAYALIWITYFHSTYRNTCSHVCSATQMWSYYLAEMMIYIATCSYLLLSAAHTLLEMANYLKQQTVTVPRCKIVSYLDSLRAVCTSLHAPPSPLDRNSQECTLLHRPPHRSNCHRLGGMVFHSSSTAYPQGKFR